MKMIGGQKNAFCTQHIYNLQGNPCLRSFQRRPLRRFACQAAELLEIPSKFSKVDNLNRSSVANTKENKLYYVRSSIVC